MKTKIILMNVMVIALLFTNSFIYAQGCCGPGGSCGGKNSFGSTNNSNRSVFNPNKYATNGGVVKQVEKYNIEMVFGPLLAQDPLAFFVMNKKGKPMSNLGITGKAEITYANGSTKTIILEPSGENGFVGQMENKTSSFICILTFQIKGKNVNARFDIGTTGKENMKTAQVSYACPMHPEVKSDKRDNCRKCGMTFEECKLTITQFNAKSQ